MESWERISYLIEHLGLNKNSFSKEVGFNNNGTIGRIINEKRNPSSDTIDRIIKRFPQISYDWLRIGIGEIEETQNTVPQEAHSLSEMSFLMIPFIPITARAGYLRGYGDQEYVDSLPLLPVPADRNFKGKYRVFEVEGDSMDDDTKNAICDKDKILCREVKRELWQSKLHFKDWYFVIVHKTEGVLVKEIISHNMDSCEITCHSLNSMFDDFTLCLDEVSELYSVVKLVDRNTRK